MRMWSSMEATSPNTHCGYEKLALDKPSTMTADKSQRMRAHMPGWGTNELLHCKLEDVATPNKTQHDARQSKACRCTTIKCQNNMHKLPERNCLRHADATYWKTLYILRP